MANRKDNKGRVLKSGESQRKDGLYQYRYTDIRGKRRTIYHSDLSKLRAEESKILQEISRGIDYAEGEISVIDLVERYVAIKRDSVKQSTIRSYQYILRKLAADDFGYKMIRSVKSSDVKSWFQKLDRQGISRNSILRIRGVLKPAFASAVEDDILLKSPLQFRLDFLSNKESNVREALSPELVNKFIQFVASDSRAHRYLDIYIILLGTGMRVSELCGLTFRSIDMKNRSITIDHQLIRKQMKGTETYVDTPKSKTSNRIIPMSNEVYEALQRVLESRPQLAVEPMIGGHSGFLFVSPSGSVMTSNYVSKAIWSAIKRYNAKHADQLPSFSPHNLRHTFCTNMIDAGADIKAVQYLMGHAKASITLDVYTHTSYKKAEASFRKIMDSHPPIFHSTTPLLHQNAVEL